MTTFRADLPGLERLVERLSSFDAKVETSIGDLDGAVRRTHGQWSGAAAAAHLDAHRRWLDAAGRMRDAAADLHTLVGTARRNYSAAIDANSRMWS